MKVDLTTVEIEKPGVATALSTLFAAVAGSFTVTPKDAARNSTTSVSKFDPPEAEGRTIINSYEPFGKLEFTRVTADEMEQLIRNDKWTSGPYYGAPWVFGTLKEGTRVGYDRRLGTNYANAAVADAWASKTHLVQRMTDKYVRQDQADRGPNAERRHVVDQD